jgi:predicted dehydrogenase
VEKVRLAPVGLGRWARVLARGAQRGEVIDLVSCFSRSEEKRTSFCEEFGIARSARSYEELLADPDVEGVLVTTPNDTHREVIIQAIDAGKAVYTDKPIAHNLEDAVAIGAATTESGHVFSVGHSARRLAGHREMKRWVDEGRLGRISLAEANFSNERGLELTPQTWRYFSSKSPGGALIQLGVHHADTLQYLLGPVRSVSATVRKLYTKSEVADATMTILELEAGMLAYLGSGWASPGVYSMNLLGTEANLFYDLDFTHWQDSHSADKHSVLRSQSYGESDRRPVELRPSDMFREQLEEFALAIRGEGEVEVGAAEGIDALAVVQGALESSARGGESVELQEVVATARARSQA